MPFGNLSVRGAFTFKHLVLAILSCHSVLSNFFQNLCPLTNNKGRKLILTAFTLKKEDR